MYLYISLSLSIYVSVNIFDGPDKVTSAVYEIYRNNDFLIHENNNKNDFFYGKKN